MLVLTAEVWPYGRSEAAKLIGVVAAANVSEVREMSDYVIVWRDDTSSCGAGFLADHRRLDGFWPLAARMAERPSDLPVAFARLADRMGALLDQSRLVP